MTLDDGSGASQPAPSPFGNLGVPALLLAAAIVVLLWGLLGEDVSKGQRPW